MKRLQSELVMKEEQMEDLRDMNASRVSEYQIMIQNLKGNLLKQKKEFQIEKNERNLCQEVLVEILGVIEREEKVSCNQFEFNEKEKLREEFLSLQKELERKSQQDLQQIQEVSSRQVQVEREVRGVMEEALKRIEINSWEFIENKVMLLESQLSSTQLESVAREERLSAEREERINQLTAERDERINQLTAERDERIGQLTAEREERINQLAAESDEKINQLTAEHQNQMERLQEQFEKLQGEYDELKKELELHLKGEEENTALAGQLSSEIQQRDQSIQLLRDQVVKSGHFSSFPLASYSLTSSLLSSGATECWRSPLDCKSKRNKISIDNFELSAPESHQTAE